MKSEQQFRNDFQRSNEYVNLVAYWLTCQGISAKILPNMLRPDVSLRHEYFDAGDIEIALKIEVKHRGIDFTSKDDYPYPTILIDEVYKLDRKLKDLYAYVILNKAANVAIFVLKSTRKQWKQVKKFDRDANEERTFYEVSKEVGVFTKIGGQSSVSS